MSEADLLRSTKMAYDMVFKSSVDFFSLKAAFDLGLFTALGRGPRNLETLAEATRSVPLRLDKFLTALEQIGLVTKKDSEWELTPFAVQYFLPTERPSNLTMVPFVEYISSIIDTYYVHLAEVVRGERDFTSFIPYPPRTRDHSEFYETLHRSNIYYPVRLLLERGKLEKVRHLVDIGGGIGDIAAAVCRRYPELNVTLVNLPSAIELVLENIAAQGLAGRVNPIAVDMNREPFPPGDGLLISRILYPFNAHIAAFMFKKAFEALEPGGRFFVLDMITTDPEAPNYDFLTHYLSSVGTDFAIMEFKDHRIYAEVLANTGFTEIECDEAYEHVLYQAVKPLS